MIRRRALFIFIPVALLMLTTWAIYMHTTSSWQLFADNWFMTVTMIFGSFIAGASSEGGGAIAYPVMTLLFNIEPNVARNFSFAIQSIGMVMASFWILVSKIRIEKNYLLIAGIGGFFGIIAGSVFIAPYVKPDFAKMMFVSFWLSFGIALWVVNFLNHRKSVNKLPDLNRFQTAELLMVGLVGGIFSSILGNGLDICTFSYVVLKYRLSEKIATPTSVILMASNAVVGFGLNTFILDTMQTEAINYWLVSIPVVIFGAPVGAYLITLIKRKTISMLLIMIIVIQFFTALYIVRPNLELTIFSVLVFSLGILIFFVLTKHKSNKPNTNP